MFPCGYAFEWKTNEQCKEWYDVFRTLYRSQEEMDWKEMSRSLESTKRKLPSLNWVMAMEKV